MNNEQLVAEYAATRSPVSLDQVVRDNQRLLHHVLKRFATADEPYEDLLQVANLGLIKAVQRFDPTMACASRRTPCRSSKARSAITCATRCCCASRAG